MVVGSTRKEMERNRKHRTARPRATTKQGRCGPWRLEHMAGRRSTSPLWTAASATRRPALSKAPRYRSTQM